MDGTTNNNITWHTGTATTADDTVSWWNSTITASDTNTVWFPFYMESTWVPYSFEKYIPKWHIQKGYFNQIKHMWD